jgi:hypothetical protein
MALSGTDFKEKVRTASEIPLLLLTPMNREFFPK